MAAVRNALLGVVEAARTESGNLRYDLHQLKNNPGGFYALATWADQGALEAHQASPPMRSIMTQQVAAGTSSPRPC